MNTRPILPALVLAAGVLAATAVSLRTSSSFASAMIGPVLLAVTMAVARIIRDGISRAQWIGDAILGGAVVVAGGIIAFSDPAFVPSFMPILGATAAMRLMPERTRTCSLG